jgi:hypothetical protein
MIPSGYKSQKVYSVLPTNGDGDLTFDRNNAGSRVNKNGLIEQVATDVPRLDYSDGSCPSLLLEPASTNLALYSEDFSQWDTFSQGSGTTPIVTLNNSISPDGANNATRLQCSLNGGTTTSDRSYIKYGGLSTTPFLTTKSLYIKNNKSTEVVLYIGINNSADIITIPANSPFARYEVSNTNINNEFRIGIQGGHLNSDSIDIDIWGAQLEEQPYATSYIPTTTGSASRGADSASKDGLSSYISSTAGVLYAEFASLSDEDNTTRIISLNSGTLMENRIFIGFSNTDNRIYVGIRNLTVAYFTPTDSTVFHKVAIKYEDNNTKLFVNGNQIGSTETTQTVPSGLSQIQFTAGSTTAPFHGKVKDLRVYNTALTDLELQELTTI